ncbi:MAG: SDR family oxidoreductase [Halodesulfurarchaeum sp.]|nr:SDR family oxidoreductase [Halodesulfurarchaeum sp.]
MTEQRVGILGCGYVGTELARQLRDEYEVYGVRRSSAGLEAVAETGAEPIRADLTDPDDVTSLPDADVLVFTASSRGNPGPGAIYNTALESVITNFGPRRHPPDRLIYTGSTGVYGDFGGDWVDEETPIEPETDRQEILREAERLTLETAPEFDIDGTVVRFGGLYGPDRYRMDRYLEGPVTAGYLNLVHREDAAGAVAFLIEGDRLRNETLLAVDDEPLDKWQFADWLAEAIGVAQPPKQTVDDRLEVGTRSTATRQRIVASKRCSNQKLREIGYEYRFPTAYDGYEPAIEAARDGAR